NEFLDRLQEHFAISRLEFQRGEAKRAAFKGGLSVLEADVVGGKDLKRPGILQDFHGFHDGSDLQIARARVHDERAPDSAGDSDQRLGPAEPALGALLHERRKIDAGSGANRSRPELDLLELSAETDNDARDPRVADQKVGPAPDKENRETVGLGE